MKLKPLADRVILKQFKAEEKTKSGLILAASAQEKPEMFEVVEVGPGGMVDAEFAVQYLVLSQSAAHPELRGNLGNIALLQRAESVGLLPPGIGQAAGDAYRELRRQQHLTRLSANPKAPVERAQVQAASTAIRELWRMLF